MKRGDCLAGCCSTAVVILGNSGLYTEVFGEPDGKMVFPFRAEITQERGNYFVNKMKENGYAATGLEKSKAMVDANKRIYPDSDIKYGDAMDAMLLLLLVLLLLLLSLLLLLLLTPVCGL